MFNTITIVRARMSGDPAGIVPCRIAPVRR